MSNSTFPYSNEQISSWQNLNKFLENPITFPNATSNFSVVFTADPPNDQYKTKYPFQKGEPILFLGEIQGMKGHGIFAKDNSIHYAYHTHLFAVIPEEEL